MSNVDAIFSRGFRQGVEAAKETATTGGSTGRLVEYLSLGDGETAYFRFLTDHDEVMDVRIHSFYPTKPKPEGYTGNWPQTVSSVCRRTELGDGLPMFSDCWCCDHPKIVDGKTRGAISRTLGLVVLREEVLSDGESPQFRLPHGSFIPKGRRAGFRDKKKSYQAFGDDNQPEGVPQLIPDIRVLEFGWKNFWAGIHAIAQIHGTLMNQEMVITRTGKDFGDTQYNIQGLGVSKDFRDPKELARYGITFSDQIDPATGGRVKVWPEHLDLRYLVYNKASDEYYARWIDPTKTIATPSGATAAKTSVSVVKSQAQEQTQASLADMRARLVGRTAAAEEVPAAASVASSEPSPVPPAVAPTAVALAAPVAVPPVPEEGSFDPPDAPLGMMSFD